MSYSVMAHEDGFNSESKRLQLTEGKTVRPKLIHTAHCAADAASVAPAGRHQTESKSPRITTAEQRVLALVVQAKTNKEIATNLGISPATVKRHIENILTKFGLRNRVEAAIYGLMLTGCPHKSSSGCVVRKLQTGSDDSAFSWPIDP